MGLSIKKDRVILKKQLINIQIIIFVFIQLLLFGNIENVIAQEFKKRPFTFSYQVGLSPFEFSEELQRSCSISIDLFEIKKTFVGINIARFSANARANCITSYSDPRITTHYLVPPPPTIGHAALYYTYKTFSYGLFFSKLVPKSNFNMMWYLSLNFMMNKTGFEQQSIFNLWPLTIYCKRKYSIDTQPTFDLFLKCGFFSKKEKRVYIAVSPFMRYSYLKLNSISYVNYGEQLDRISSIDSYTKHLYTLGIALDILRFRKKS